MEIFSGQNITKTFTNHLALDNVSISVSEGSIFGLLGPNGAGKTTLLRIINQITAPDQGSLLFKGEKLTSSHIEQIGYLPEERGLYKKMKVGEQALYLAQLKGLSKKEAIEKLNIWFEKFEIQTWYNKKVEDLSKGMQQKIQFIITVLHEPSLLIFDEPFSGFDPINANIVKQEILRLKENGATIIFSTHNMESVEELCDHITLLNNAKNILTGPIQQIREKYKSNTYEIVFDGLFNKLQASLTAMYEILDIKIEDKTTTVKIKINEKATTNDVLGLLMNCGKIISLNELVPNMNEIFIKAVQETNSINE